MVEVSNLEIVLLFKDLIVYISQEYRRIEFMRNEEYVHFKFWKK